MLRRRIIFKKVSIEIPFSQAAVGDILCTDNRIVSPVNYPNSGKFADGIVVHKGGGILRIMALTPVSGKWGGYAVDTSLSNVGDQQAAINDTTGDINTLTMIGEIGNIPDDSIAISANNYSTISTTVGWYMPAIGEVYMIGQNWATINASRQAIGLPLLGNYTVIMASSEYSAEYNWYGYYVSNFNIYPDMLKYLTNYSTYPFVKKNY